MTKRKKDYPRSNNKRAIATPGSQESQVRPNLATINVEARKGREGFSVGDRVRIEAEGLFSREIATIESMSNGVIPSALVVTDNGGRRQVRTIDLVPAKAE
jgi:hypothetical protein